MGYAHESYTPQSACQLCVHDIYGMDSIFDTYDDPDKEPIEHFETIHASLLDEARTWSRKSSHPIPLPYIRLTVISGWLISPEEIADDLRTEERFYSRTEILDRIKSGSIPAFFSESCGSYVSNMGWLFPRLFEVPREDQKNYHRDDLYFAYPHPGVWTLSYLASAPHPAPKPKLAS
jgi:hypothetical protein